MGTPAITPNIQGLPPGASLKPIQGLPPGAELKPIANPGLVASGSAPPSLLQRAGTITGDALKGVAKGAMHTGSTLIHAINTPMLPTADGSNQAVPEVGNFADKMEQKSAPSNLTQRIGRGVEQVGEFFIPGLGEEDAATHAAPLLEKVLPKTLSLPAAKLGVAALGSGTVNKVQGGDFGIGAAAGGIGAGLGMGLKALAPSLAETALRVRGNDRLYGRTVGDAILNDTSGVRPATIAKTAQQTISRLTPELEQTANQASQNGARGSLLPARNSLQTTIGRHTSNRATDSISELSPLQDRLATDSITGQPLAPQQTPTGLLQLKRGINSDFIQNWKPDQPPGLRSSAKTAYGNLADEFHASAPGTQQLDQRISSLIPVTKRAETVSNGAGLLQRTAGRIGAHTGAATMGVGGAYEGGKVGGLPGAIAGGALGILAPEMLSSPTGQMIMARGMFGAAPKVVIPAIRGAALQADRKDKK